jgi:YVTN family beta-propeller protein
MRIHLAHMIPVGQAPSGVLLVPARNELYVINSLDSSVSVISTAQKRVVRTIKIDVPSLPGQFGPVVCSADQMTAFLRGLDSLVTFSLVTGKSSVRKVPGIRDIVITNDGSSLFLAAGKSGLFKLHLASGDLRAISSLPAPTGLALTREGRYLYVSYQSGGPGGRWGHDAIGKFDVASGALVQSITGLANVGGSLVLSPDGKQLWANGLDACYSRRYDHLGCPIVPGGIINVLDTSSGKLIRSIGVAGDSHTYQLAFSPDGGLLAANGAGLRLIDKASFRVVGSWGSSETSSTLFDPAGTIAYTCLYNENAVAILSVNRR